MKEVQRQPGCELCDLTVPVVWQDEKLSVILVDDAAYPGFCRVIWRAAWAHTGAGKCASSA